MTERDVVVVGAGVVGLSCALVLAERGHRVRVLASEIAGGVSAVAASLWAPSHVERSERVRSWAYATLARLRRDASADSGIREQLARTVGLAASAGDPWMRGFVAPLRAATPDELPEGYGAGTIASIPLVDTSHYLPSLVARCRQGGVVFETRVVDDLDSLGSDDLESDAVVVLAAGLGAAALAGDDTVRPLRSQVARLDNPGLTRTTMVRDGPLAPLFIVPRFDDVIVGGPAEDGAWNPEPDPAVEAAILRRAIAAEPALAGAAVLGRAVGHRPVRESVRVEREIIAGRNVVHCYGHGGAGIALSWGTADAAAELVESA